MIPTYLPVLLFLGGTLLAIWSQLHRIADALEERNRRG